METLGSTDQKPFLTLHHVSRRFGSVLANRDISLNLFEGEIHAIVGENGAGKSTLMKILCGELQPDSGEIRIDGCPTAFRRPQEAIRAGIGMAHQHFLIFPQLTALENIIAGGEPGTWGWLRRRRANEELLALCRSVGFALPLDVPASGLSFAHRQQIEILRLLYRQVKVLVFDEPTSLLAPPETERFLDLLRTLQASGHTVLFISHRLHEVLAIADRISVLRRGKWAGTFLKSEITVERLVRVVISGSPAPYPGTAPPKEDASAGTLHLHTGLLLSKAKPPPAANHDHYATLTPRPPTVPLLQMKDVTTRACAQEAGLDRFSLEIFKGEVFGLGGVVGNGQRTLALLLSGMLPAARGTVVLSGREITSLSVSERLAMGLRWLPANPQEEALLPSRSLWENLLLGRQRQPRLHHHGWLNRRFIKHWAAEQLDRNGVVYASLHDPLSSLSGGNSQKLALCRVLEGSPALVILEQPSRGLDIRAQEHLRNQVRELNRQGITIMVISYDLDELLELSHRLGIMYRGRLMGLTAPPEASRERLGSWMLGVETGDFKLKD